LLRGVHVGRRVYEREGWKRQEDGDRMAGRHIREREKLKGKKTRDVI
jgi:hypothetical protein